jgi:hypothetical protein
MWGRWASLRTMATGWVLIVFSTRRRVSSKMSVIGVASSMPLSTRTSSPV